MKTRLFHPALVLASALALTSSGLAQAPRLKRRQAGRRVPLPQRGLVAVGRASAHARAVAGIAVRDEGGVY